jgi:hypothetical protein
VCARVRSKVEHGIISYPCDSSYTLFVVVVSCCFNHMRFARV